jgi:hypothetical protein
MFHEDVVDMSYVVCGGPGSSHMRPPVRYEDLHFVDQAMGTWLLMLWRLMFPCMKSVEDESLLEPGRSKVPP